MLQLLLLLFTRDEAAQGQPITPTLWEHFFVDGCSFSPGGQNLTWTLPLRRLAGQGGFFLELDIYGPHTPMLTAGSDMCTLSSSSFFRVTTEREENKRITLSFAKVPVQLDDTDDEKLDDEEDDPGSGTEKEEKCTLPSSNLVTLQTGYGFISCRGLEARAEAVSSLLAWKEDVKEIEAEAAFVRTKILGGVGGGMALLILGCAVCVAMRVRSSGDVPARGGRRPSQISSTRTRHTSDGHSSMRLNSTKISN